LIRGLALGLAVVGSVALAPLQALASEVFPGAIQEAANMKCVPLCTLCHTSNPGNNSTWQSKTLPLQLVGHGVVAGDADSLKAAWAKFLIDPDPAAVPPAVRAAIVAQVAAGQDQTGADICGPTYGCGAHIAKQQAAPRDLTGPLWIVGAVVIGALRRRTRAA
jgi:hypothetical protein